ASRIPSPTSLVIDVYTDRCCVVVQYLRQVLVVECLYAKNNLILFLGKDQLVVFLELPGGIRIILHYPEGFRLEHPGQRAHACQPRLEFGFTVTRQNCAILASRLDINRISNAAIDSFDAKYRFIILNRKVGFDLDTAIAQRGNALTDFGQDHSRDFRRLRNKIINHFEGNVTLGYTRLQRNHTAGCDTATRVILNILKWIALPIDGMIGFITQGNQIFPNNGCTGVRTAVSAVLMGWISFVVIASSWIEL